ncbi:hypothetical protein KUF71_011355, partial [Frankliniella fusca]
SLPDSVRSSSPERSSSSPERSSEECESRRIPSLRAVSSTMACLRASCRSSLSRLEMVQFPVVEWQRVVQLRAPAESSEEHTDPDDELALEESGI